MPKPKHLARKLRGYYSRARNGQIKFRNGLSLTHMAWRMSEVGQCEIEPSSLSRILSRDRLPTLCQLKAFCDVLDLSEQEKWELEYATIRDYCERDGFEFDLSDTAPVINMLVRNVEQLRKAIDQGAFDIAVEMLRDFYLSRSELEDEVGPSVPLVRVISLVELERSLLMNALSRTAYGEAGSSENVVQIWDYDEEHDLATLLESMALTDLERRLAQLYYVEGLTAEAIAESEELTEATVYSVLEAVKHMLLQRLAEDPNEQPGG